MAVECIAMRGGTPGALRHVQTLPDAQRIVKYESLIQMVESGTTGAALEPAAVGAWSTSGWGSEGVHCAREPGYGEDNPSDPTDLT